VCDLRDQVPVAANLLSYHLRVLRDARMFRPSRPSVSSRSMAAVTICSRVEFLALLTGLPARAGGELCDPLPRSFGSHPGRSRLLQP